MGSGARWRVSLSLGRYMDDPAGLAEVLDAVDALGENPRPPVSFHRGAQPGRTTRLADGGSAASRRAGRMGRRTSSPPQFGQTPCRTFSAQSRHQVHS
jgi:hypothetical protein